MEEITEEGMLKEGIMTEGKTRAVLDMSLQKQRKGTGGNLYKKVLVDNAVKSLQQEINRKIMEAFLFF